MENFDNNEEQTFFLGGGGEWWACGEFLRKREFGQALLFHAPSFWGPKARFFPNIGCSAFLYFGWLAHKLTKVRGCVAHTYMDMQWYNAHVK